MRKAAALYCGKARLFWNFIEERVKLFEKYADLTICEDGLDLEETIEAVLETIQKE